MPHRILKPRFHVPDLAIPEREGGYVRGHETYELILRSALSLMIEQGFRAMSMRRVAAECGMKLGNLTYYFPTREDLVRALFEAVIHSYEIEFDTILHEEEATPEQRLTDLCTLLLEDIRTKKTTRFFPELWALANHDPFVADRVNDLYARARVALDSAVAEINPGLSPARREMLVLWISASMEGLTVFAGFEKPFEPRMPELAQIAIQGFIDLAKSLGEVPTVK
jgi:AcrR family transcriptional regulator